MDLTSHINRRRPAAIGVGGRRDRGRRQRFGSFLESALRNPGRRRPAGAPVHRLRGRGAVGADRLRRGDDHPLRAAQRLRRSRRAHAPDQPAFGYLLFPAVLAADRLRHHLLRHRPGDGAEDPVDGRTAREEDCRRSGGGAAGPRGGRGNRGGVSGADRRQPGRSGRADPGSAPAAPRNRKQGPRGGREDRRKVAAPRPHPHRGGGGEGRGREGGGRGDAGDGSRAWRASKSTAPRRPRQ